MHALAPSATESRPDRDLASHGNALPAATAQPAVEAAGVRLVGNNRKAHRKGHYSDENAQLSRSSSSSGGFTCPKKSWKVNALRRYCPLEEGQTPRRSGRVRRPSSRVLFDSSSLATVHRAVRAPVVEDENDATSSAPPSSAPILAKSQGSVVESAQCTAAPSASSSSSTSSFPLDSIPTASKFANIPGDVFLHFLI
eukprot:RCo049032